MSWIQIFEPKPIPSPTWKAFRLSLAFWKDSNPRLCATVTFDARWFGYRKNSQNARREWPKTITGHFPSSSGSDNTGTPPLTTPCHETKKSTEILCSRSEDCFNSRPWNCILSDRKGAVNSWQRSACFAFLTFPYLGPNWWYQKHSKTTWRYLKTMWITVNLQLLGRYYSLYWEDIGITCRLLSRHRFGIARHRLVRFWSSMPDRRYKTRVARWTRYLVSSFLFSVKQCENHKINRNQERSRKVMKGHHTGHTAIQILWPMLTSCWLLRPHHLALLKGHSRLWRSSSIWFCEPCARNPCKPRQTGSR